MTNVFELQTILYYDYYYTWVVLWITLILHLYKLSILPFPGNLFAFEIVMLVAYGLVSFARISAGSNGNRIESNKMIFLQIILTCFSVVGNAFFMDLQTYIFHVEFFMHTIALIFTCFALLMAVRAVVYWCLLVRD